MLYNLLICLFLLLPGIQNVTEADCAKEIKKLSDYYNKHYRTGKMYLKYNNQIIEDGHEAKKLLSELWISGKKYKYENKFIIVMQDEKNQVTILKERKLIIIRSVATKDKKIMPDIPLSAQMDSLNKLASTLNCSGTNSTGTIVAEFPSKIAGKPNPLKQIKLDYDLGTGELRKGEYEYYQGGGKVNRCVFEYLEFSEHFDELILESSVIKNVLTNNKLNAFYKAYTLRDLRSKK